VASGWRRQITAGQWPVPNDPDPSSESAWWGLYLVRFLLGMALLEGAALMQVIFYFVEGLPLSLGVALGLLVMMLTRFPTRLGVESWVTEQRELIERVRQDQL